MGKPLMIELRRVGDRYLASITLTPLPGVNALPGAQKVSAHGVSAKSKAKALAGAADMAKRIMANPVLAAIMPPQAATAIKAISAISKLASAGKLKSIWKRFKGPAMKRLAKVIK